MHINVMVHMYFMAKTKYHNENTKARNKKVFFFVFLKFRAFVIEFLS